MTVHTNNHVGQLETGLDQLHTQSQEWQNKIAFWKDETSFLEKLIGKTALNIDNDRNKKELEHFQNKLFYYRGEVLDTMRHDIHSHEKGLAEMMHEEKTNDRTYRDTHNRYTESLNSFEKEYHNLKKEIFSFVERHI